jgi:hypothetical protein
MEKLINGKGMETSVRANDRNSRKVGVNRFQKPGTTATGRAVARAEMNDVGVGMVAHAVPKNLVFVVNESVLVDWVIRSHRTGAHGNREFIKNHIIPIFPVERRPVWAVAEANTGNMEMRNIPRNPTISKPETSRRRKCRMAPEVARMWEQ